MLLHVVVSPPTHALMYAGLLSLFIVYFTIWRGLTCDMCVEKCIVVCSKSLGFEGENIVLNWALWHHYKTGIRCDKSAAKKQSFA